jgi:class 3 adenylate cyclase/predicted ATPase
MRCQSCSAENPEGAKFCIQCASPFKRRCQKCGSENPPEARFCSQCATSLIEDAGQPPKAAAGAASSCIRVAVDSSEPQALEGERKTVTALFADIKGSTELERDLDPEEARAIIDPALKLMMNAVHRYGGYVAQSTGDGIFALFGAPGAHEDHPQRALHAALAMQTAIKGYAARMIAQARTPIEIRVGAHTGEVVMRPVHIDEAHAEYTPIGHPVNLASRMQPLAPTGSIAVTEEMQRLTEGYFQFRSLGPAKVKGVDEPINVYEVTGLGPLRTRLQRSAGRGYTKFVGRQREVEAMGAAAEQAKAGGHGQIVAAIADAGVGKSRLLVEFKATSQAGWMVLETLSVSHGKASAYLPLINLLHSYFGIDAVDDSRKRREKVNDRIVTLELLEEDTRPYLFALLGIVEGDDPLAQMDAQVRKRRTLDAIKQILLRESLNQPLMVIFEDLHWIDGETQEFLNLLADSIGTAKILLLVTYRPEYSHRWGSKTYYTQLRLDPLGKDSAEEMLSALLGESPELTPLKRLIIEKTEGNPFFMEEIFQALVEDGTLLRNGSIQLMHSVEQLRLPPTVQGILTSRIDRLAADEKDLLQTLAVIGKEFPLALAREVVNQPDDELRRMLSDLQLAEFIYEQPALGDVEYQFKHALTRQVAYDSLLHERRRVLHERAGKAIEALFVSHLDDHLTELAHHFTNSANAAKAVRYLTLAGAQAWGRSAYTESQVQLQQGLAWINKLPASAERDARELELANALVLVLQLSKGFGAHETREAAARAGALAEKSGNLAQIVVQIHAISTVAFAKGDYWREAMIADQEVDLAEREGSAKSLALAYHNQMHVHFYRGDPVGAEEYFARWSGVREAADFGQDLTPVVTALALGSYSAWMLGHADSARERIAAAIAFALDRQNRWALAVARALELLLCGWLREPRRAEATAEQALALADEHGFPQTRGMNRVILGWAQAQLGRTGEGVALIRQGIADLHETGTRARITDYLACLAEAQALDGAIDDALLTIEEAHRANPEELVFQPNILTVRGKLRLKGGRVEQAEADFREAIALAQKMSAKALELRATTSLARLLRDTNRRGEAQAMLADIYSWFTEGFDTADLKDAKVLLDELSI